MGECSSPLRGLWPRRCFGTYIGWGPAMGTYIWYLLINTYLLDSFLQTSPYQSFFPVSPVTPPPPAAPPPPPPVISHLPGTLTWSLA